ncbi:hypothetical protein DSL92_03295 [Billgrantia gudaonensis]|uniref:valine--tRNA ligase n=1 Tax=Billgrantia gudaonensis TaxID=376427 RepID=A0A3S0NX89_9GAMM|nr:hypothetical protein DSL92_03295 [Halomonas gudaonensis]
MDRFEARKRIVADIRTAGLLEQVETVSNTLPYGDRSGDVIEPLLTDQWFVAVEKPGENPPSGRRERRHRVRAKNYGTCTSPGCATCRTGASRDGY